MHTLDGNSSLALFEHRLSFNMQTDRDSITPPNPSPTPQFEEIALLNCEPHIDDNIGNEHRVEGAARPGGRRMEGRKVPSDPTLAISRDKNIHGNINNNNDGDGDDKGDNGKMIENKKKESKDKKKKDKHLDKDKIKDKDKDLDKVSRSGKSKSKSQTKKKHSTALPRPSRVESITPSKNSTHPSRHSQNKDSAKSRTRSPINKIKNKENTGPADKPKETPHTTKPHHKEPATPAKTSAPTQPDPTPPPPVFRLPPPLPSPHPPTLHQYKPILIKYPLIYNILAHSPTLHAYTPRPGKFSTPN